MSSFAQAVENVSFSCTRSHHVPSSISWRSLLNEKGFVIWNTRSDGCSDRVRVREGACVLAYEQGESAFYVEDGKGVAVHFVADLSLRFSQLFPSLQRGAATATD